MLAQGYFCGLFLLSVLSSSHQVFYMQGRFYGRAPVYCIPWHSALVGAVESTITTRARGENGLNSFNLGKTVPFLLPSFYGCRQCCLLFSDRTDRLLTNPSSLPSCGRQAGTSVLSLAWRLCRSSPVGDNFGFEHVERSLHMSVLVPRYGLRLVGSQFHLLLHHCACCYYLF